MTISNKKEHETVIYSTHSVIYSSLWLCIPSAVHNRKAISTKRNRQIIPDWLDSELIPRLLENFENWKNFIIILLNIKNDAYRRIFGA